MYPLETPYETTAFRSYDLDKILTELRISLASGHVRELGDASDRTLLLLSKLSDCPVFHHPVLMDDYMVADVRALGKYSDETGNFIITKNSEYKLTINRAMSASYWRLSDENKDTLYSISDFPMRVFTAIISESITHRLALMPEVQAKVAVAAGLFFISQFNPADVELTEREWLRRVSATAKATRITVPMIMEWFPKPISFSSVSEFTHFLAGDTMDNPRLKKFDNALFFGIMSSIFRGGSVAPAEIVASSIEYPPGWMSIVSAATTERGLSKTPLGRKIESLGKRGDEAQMFARTFHAVITHKQ